MRFMNKIFSPRFTAFAAAILVIYISMILPNALKSWFVSETGQISIAPGLSLLLVAGILFRWSWSRMFGIFLFGVIFGATLLQLIFFNHGYTKGPALLLALTGLLLALLSSREMKAYFYRKGATEWH